MRKVLAAQYYGPLVEQAVDFTETDEDTTLDKVYKTLRGAIPCPFKEEDCPVWRVQLEVQKAASYAGERMNEQQVKTIGKMAATHWFTHCHRCEHPEG